MAGTMKNAHVLVVDDDEDIRNLLDVILQEEGFSVQTAEDGCDALLKIETDPPQFLLLDLMMPRMTGEEVLRSIKSDPALEDIRVLIISAREGSRNMCLEMGAEDFFLKPIDLNRLIRT